MEREREREMKEGGRECERERKRGREEKGRSVCERERCT